MQTAIITGASYGIGKSIAEELLHNEWKVYGLSRSDPQLESERFTWLQCDLSQKSQIIKSLQKIKEPVIDALVSNAGIIYIEDATAVNVQTYEKTFSVNVLAPMIIVTALAQKLKEATILSVSSVSDRIPESAISLYCSSKAANTMYFNTVAADLKQARVITLLPDYVDTPMLRGTMGSNKKFDWNSTIQTSDIAELSSRLITGTVAVPSGANIIIVTEKLKHDLQSIEKLYGFNTDSQALIEL